MPAAEHLKRTFRGLQIFVAVASTLLSGFFGGLASLGYGPESPQSDFMAHDTVSAVGMIIGGLAGLIAGLFWSYVLREATLKSLASKSRVSLTLVPLGLGAGAVVGIAATAVLHIAMAAVTQQWSHIDFVVLGQMFGIPAGLGLGLFCGFVWWAICSASVKPAEPQP